MRVNLLHYCNGSSFKVNLLMKFLIFEVLETYVKFPNQSLPSYNLIRYLCAYFHFKHLDLLDDRFLIFIIFFLDILVILLISLQDFLVLHCLLLGLISKLLILLFLLLLLLLLFLYLLTFIRLSIIYSITICETTLSHFINAVI